MQQQAIISIDEFCDKFAEVFPNKPESTPDAGDYTEAWMRVIDGAPTSGEGCIIKGLPIVDYYSGREPLYLFSILSEVNDWANTHGYFAELQDPGTVKFYPV